MSKELKLYKKPFHYKKHALATPETPLIFLIGDKSKEAYQFGDGYTWKGIIDKLNAPPLSVGINNQYKPLLLTQNHLPNINNVELASEDHKNFIFFECGKVTDDEKQTLIRNLATKTNAKYSKVYYYTGEHSEHIGKDGTEHIFTYNKEPENLNENGKFESVASGNDVLDNIYKEISEQPEEVPEGYLTYSDYFNKELADNQRCEEVLNWYEGNIRKANNGAYKFNGKTWECLNDEGGLSRVVSNFLKAKDIKYSSAMKKNVTSLLGDELELLGTPKPHLMAFNNGVLDKQTGKLLPHDKEHYLTAINDCDYWVGDNPPSTPYFDKVMNSFSNNNQKELDTLMAILYGAVFLPDGWQYFYELSGQGGTGKSTFISIIRLLIGENNCCTITLNDFVETHGLTNAVGKQGLISYDEEHFKRNSARLKMVTAREPIPINPKGLPKFETTINGVVVYSSNEPIAFISPSKGGEDSGIARRRVIKLFDRVIDEKDKIPDLDGKLKKECGGIMYKVLNKFKGNVGYAKSLIEKQKNSKEAIMVKAQSEWLYNFVDCFEAVEWVNGSYVKNQGCLKVGCKDGTYPFDPQTQRNTSIYKVIFRAYQYWHECDENTRKPMGKRKFLETLFNVCKNKGMNVQIKKVGNQEYINLKWKDDPIETVSRWEN